jgi:DNA-directed RNA polymerase subunit beta
MPGDILVGKISPKPKGEASPEEKLLQAIFGKSGEEVKDDSLRAPVGTEGYILDVKHFTKRSQSVGEDISEHIQKIQRKAEEVYIEEVKKKFYRLEELLGKAPGEGLMAESKSGKPATYTLKTNNYRAVKETQEATEWGSLLDIPEEKLSRAKAICQEHDRRAREIDTRRDVDITRLRHGYDLQSPMLEFVKVYIAVKHKLSLGDKMAGRHGNKGVVARILPEEDMPFLEDGMPVQMILNPLGVPSRMNVGQILETHLGWAASEHKDAEGNPAPFRAVTPVFDGASEENIREALKESKLPESGKAIVYDGRTGEPFHEPVTVGVMYMIKLHHLVAEKIHARGVGPYSLITQQPLGGKARNGGQRLGEMEVWAIEAYGAANILQELLTLKSDDKDGRIKLYESMTKSDDRSMEVEPGMPLSFDVLRHELKGLGLNIQLERDKRRE